MAEMQRMMNSGIAVVYWPVGETLGICCNEHNIQCYCCVPLKVVISWSRVHERWNSVPFISWSHELVITSDELELGSCTSSSPLVIKDGGGSWCGRWIFGCKSIFLQYFNRIQQYFGSL